MLVVRSHLSVAPGENRIASDTTSPPPAAWATKRYSPGAAIASKRSVVVTGDAPPTTPPTAAEYTRAGLPWFEYYSEGQSVLKGSSMLAGTKSIAEWAAEQGANPLPENESVSPQLVINLGKKPAPSVVREGEF
jgi:hypothetical protein